MMILKVKIIYKRKENHQMNQSNRLRSKCYLILSFNRIHRKRSFILMNKKKVKMAENKFMFNHNKFKIKWDKKLLRWKKVENKLKKQKEMEKIRKVKKIKRCKKLE